MNTLKIKGNWNVAKGRLQQKWGNLVQDDGQSVAGKEVELLGRIQKRPDPDETGLPSANDRPAGCGC